MYKSIATLVAVCLTAGTAQALGLKIALSESPTTMDPHHHDLRVNNQVLGHIYEGLTGVDHNGVVRPLLATAWTAVDDTTWRFDLRKGVTFHDGAAFTANDFIYTACRIARVDDSPSPFSLYTAVMTSIEAADPHTLIVNTATPHPALPAELARVGVIPAAAEVASYPDGCTAVAAWPERRDFDTGARAVGTGQFQFAAFAAGDSVTLARNSDYWTDDSMWDSLTFRTMLSAEDRLAVLKAREVDFIAAPAAVDIPWLKMSGSYDVDGGTSSRMIYLQFDHRPQAALTGTDGANPFADRRVRQAVMHAIDRDAIVAALGEVAAPAIGLAPGGTLGETARAPARFDPEMARSLLADAGYAGDFQVALAVPNDRDSHAVDVAQVIAGMLDDIGIATTLSTMSSEDFFTGEHTRQGAGLYLGEWDAGVGELAPPLRALLATPNSARGLGGANHGGYANARFDALLEKAMAAADSEARGAYLTQAHALAMEDAAIVPLYHEVMTWALRWTFSVDRRINDPKLAERIVACAHFCHGNSTRFSEHALRLLDLDVDGAGYGN